MFHAIFFLVVFPLLKPIISTIVILESMGFWNDYLLPSLVLGQRKLYTLPLAIRTFYGTFSNDYGNIMAGLVLSMLLGTATIHSRRCGQYLVEADVVIDD